MEIRKELERQVSDCRDEIKRLKERRCAAKNEFEKFLVFKIADRSILIWGAVKRNDCFIEFARKNNIKVSGYIDSYSNETTLNDYPIWKPNEITLSTKQYIIIGLKNLYEDVLIHLTDRGLIPYEDYFYWIKNSIKLTYCNGLYADYLGNQIVGNVTGYSIELDYLSNLRVGRNCKIDNSVKIILGKNAILEIGDNSILEKDSVICVKENSFVHIGKNCLLRERTNIFCVNSSITFISDDIKCGAYFRTACNNGCILIHSGCIFSTDIILQGSDGHPLYDLQQECSITNPERFVIEIGEHVWIGRRCNIRYGAKIGAGSVIGMGSFVCKEVPNNVVAAGNPLRVIREDIAWSRTKCSNPDKYFEDYDFRQ